jgi:DNA (cytosine-5)-methyltransferase 1
LADLAADGFDAEWTVVSAQEAGAPHRRNRLFALAYADRGRLEGLRSPRLPDGLGTAHGDHPDRPSCWPPGPDGDWSHIDPGLWPSVPKSSVRGVADGLPTRSDRLRVLGNAVVPAQAALAFRVLLEQAAV